MERTYKYAVLRAMPDPLRGEVVNVGVAVFHTETVDVHLSPSLAKVTALDGRIDLEEILRLPEILVEWTARFDSVEDKFNALKRFGFVSLSDLGAFTTTPAVTYADHVNSLLKTLVIPRPREVAAVPSTNRITTALRDIFRKQGVLGRGVDDIARHLVVPNFPIDTDEQLYADFALKNGAMWITETADFRAKSSGQTDKSRVAGFASIKLDRAKARFKKNFHSFIVYAAQSDVEVISQLNLMGEYADQLVNINSKADVARYMERILDAAGPNQRMTA